MIRSSDSRWPQRIGQHLAPAALVLLISVGWSHHVNAADPRIGGSAAPGTVGAGPVTALAIDPDTPTTLYAVIGYCGVFKSLDGDDS